VRLFVALTPPDPVVRELSAAVGRLRAAGAEPGLRWTPPEAWHVTLAFLGEVDEPALPELTRRLARVGERHHPLTLRLAGGGRFDDHVLWTGLAGDTTDLSHLAASVGAAARRAGLPVDTERAFRPHITLARSRGRSPLRPYATRLHDFASTPWTAHRFSLIRSHPPATPGTHPRYEDLSHWPLTPPHRP
jgi:2'-5' RNA ligase